MMTSNFSKRKYLITVGLVVAGLVHVFWLNFGRVPSVVAHIGPPHATNIHSTTTDHWAWNDLIGWINFHETDNVIVKSWELRGWASSSVGEVVLNCATTPAGDKCAGLLGQWGVTNDRAGNLAGWAWNDIIGWVSFCGGVVATSGCPVTNFPHQVDVRNPSSTSDEPPSDFFNYAWNDVVGWISFNCSDLTPGSPGYCDLYSTTSSYVDGYKVRTDWSATSTYGYLDSSVFDTGIPLGAQFNSIAFRGQKPPGTEVFFQFAASNCSNGATNPPGCTTGTWTFTGPNGATNSFYIASGKVSSFDVYYIALNRNAYNNNRYFRYRIRLKSDSNQEFSPEVREVMVNWSP